VTTAWGAAAGGGGARLLLVETQDRTPAGGSFRRDALTQARTGCPVLLFLLQDGAPLALPGSDTELDGFQRAGGLLAVDRYSLAQRGLLRAPLREHTAVVDMDQVARWVLDPDVKVVWH
jgi:hypothetical protein